MKLKFEAMLAMKDVCGVAIGNCTINENEIYIRYVDQKGYIKIGESWKRLKLCMNKPIKIGDIEIANAYVTNQYAILTCDTKSKYINSDHAKIKELMYLKD